MSDEMQGAITSFWKGMARNLADMKADGLVKIDEGKRAIPIELYEKLLLAIMQSPRNEAVFCHTYAVLSANLGCRTNNTARVALNHMSACADSCTILFAQTKSDQEGEMEMFKRHYSIISTEHSVHAERATEGQLAVQREFDKCGVRESRTSLESKFAAAAG